MGKLGSSGIHFSSNSKDNLVTLRTVWTCDAADLSWRLSSFGVSLGLSSFLLAATAAGDASPYYRRRDMLRLLKVSDPQVTHRMSDCCFYPVARSFSIEISSNIWRAATDQRPGQPARDFQPHPLCVAMAERGGQGDGQDVMSPRLSPNGGRLA